MNKGITSMMVLLAAAIILLVGLALTALYYGVIIALIYKFLGWVGILVIGML